MAKTLDEVSVKHVGMTLGTLTQACEELFQDQYLVKKHEPENIEVLRDLLYEHFGGGTAEDTGQSGVLLCNYSMPIAGMCPIWYVHTSPKVKWSRCNVFL